MNIQIMVNDVEIVPEMAIDSLEVLQVLVDGQRHRLVTLLIEAPLTAKEIADQLGLGRTRLYYHLDLLQRHGIIRVVETRTVSGLEERRYRAVARCFRVDRDLLSARASESQIADGQAAILESVATDLRARSMDDAGHSTSGTDDVLVMRSFTNLSDARRQELNVRIRALFAEYGSGDVAGRTTEFSVALFTTERAAS